MSALTPTQATQRDIEQCLQSLQPTQLQVRDDSAAHAGHAGAAGGAGHYTVHIVSATFRNKPRLARHRLVYDALHSLIPARIHALAIEAKAPEEV